MKKAKASKSGIEQNVDGRKEENCPKTWRRRDIKAANQLLQRLKA